MTFNFLKVFRNNFLFRVFICFSTIFLITACGAQKKNARFDHVECMDNIPKRLKGLKILSGPRTEKSIIHDMVPVGCYAQVLFHEMKAEGEEVNAGEVVFRVTVEYTGEVYASSVEESTIRSKLFLRKVADMIMDSDFVGWALDSDDTIFLYPMSFGD